MFLLESKWVFQCSLTLPYNKTYKNNPAKTFQASNALKHKSLNRDIQDISLHFTLVTGRLQEIYRFSKNTEKHILVYVYMFIFYISLTRTMDAMQSIKMSNIVRLKHITCILNLTRGPQALTVT